MAGSSAASSKYVPTPSVSKSGVMVNELGNTNPDVNRRYPNNVDFKM